jgi:pectinesterase
VNYIKRIILVPIAILGFLLFSQQTFADYQTKITVAQDGSGDYTSVQAAIDAAKAFPDKRVTIFIKNGVYHEKVLVPACNTYLSLIGESAGKTIITWGDYFKKVNRGRNSTFYTYTLKVEASDFVAENLTIENSAGPVGQAVALHVSGDRCVFRNCRILGHQDTLYTEGENSRQYFKHCFIEGTTDFIFGEATALFDDCTLKDLSDSYITAASTDKGKKFGYVFRHCRVIAAPGVTRAFLGRPWRPYAKVVYLHCALDKHIAPAGWMNWSGTNRDRTAYYAEYKSTGPGADPSHRVPWSHQLTDREAAKYTLENIMAPPCVQEPGAAKWTAVGE